MPKAKRVLLVTPPYHCGMVECAGVWMPLGLAYLAGAARQAGFEPEIYDAMSLGHDLPAIRRRIEQARPDVVATTAYTATINAACGMLAAAKEAVPPVVTVIGGVHPTHMAPQVLTHPEVDFVVRGEGEQAFPELLACLDAEDFPEKVAGISFREGAGLVHTPARPLIEDLDALPVAWNLLEWPIYHYRTKPGSRLAISSWARGCVHACSFCSQQKLWRRTWRPRRPAAILAELQMLKERFGVDTLEVADECPTQDGRRWERILDALIAADLGIELLVETRADHIVRDAAFLPKYRQAGILHMYVGVESVRQDRLDGMRKGLRVAESRRAISLLNDLGIITETSFLLGFPDDTADTVQQTVKLAIEYAPDLAFFLPITPWPYADMYPSVAGRVEERDYSRYNLIHPILRVDAMSREELSAHLSRAFMEFYRHKMSNLHCLPPHKQEYLRQVARLLVEHSYLAGEAKASLASRGAGHPGPAAVPKGGAG